MKDSPGPSFLFLCYFMALKNLLFPLFIIHALPYCNLISP
jgi:hypothetical protein